mmetsp:Transcript_99292/g.286506  ORF Transcript_99292/g.286506 Transcript_99292/m.286506 type:complete len:165 (-) Transcript_99292:117-611(-)
MALRKLVVLALAALGLSADMESAAVSDAQINGALLDDDTCAAASGDDAARCALQALQMKSEKLATEEDDEAQNACTSGLVGQIRSFAPGCINACPQACGPLGSAITAYMAHGGQAAAKKVICAHKSQFACAYDHWGACKTLADKAAGFGFQLPRSKGSLYSQCR